MTTNENPERNREDAHPVQNSILDAAMTLFLKCGYEGVSMDAVAKAAGVTRRTVYNRFESKEVLFDDSVKRVWLNMPVLLATTSEGASADPAIGLHEVGFVIAEFWASPHSVAFIRMVISESNRFPDLAVNFIRLGKTPALSALIGYLSEMIDKGLLSCSDPDLAARQFVGLVNEPLLWYRVIGVGDVPTQERREQVVREAVLTFLARYKNSP